MWERELCEIQSNTWRGSTGEKESGGSRADE